MLLGEGELQHNDPEHAAQEMRGRISNPGLQFQSAAAYKCVPAEVRTRHISNYPADGGSRHRGGDKWNLHVVLTSGKTERGFLQSPLHTAVNFGGDDAKQSFSSEGVKKKRLIF